SISEAQPLVILEAGAIGIPSIATDVGSCSELIYGRGPEDRALGAGGLITAMASPGQTARAILELHDSPQLRERMRDAMRARVEKFYDQRDMVSAYDEIYAHYKVTENRARAILPEPPPEPAAAPAPEPELPSELPVPSEPDGADIHVFPDPGLQSPDVDPVTATAQPGITTNTAPGSRPQHPGVDPVTSTAGSGALTQTTPGVRPQHPDVDPVTSTATPGELTQTTLDSNPQHPDVDPVTPAAESRDLTQSTPGSDPQRPDVDPVTDTAEPGELTQTGEIERIAREITETEFEE
ncbi:MAG: glycosyltransferase, partial [Planctomycetota bacterium]